MDIKEIALRIGEKADEYADAKLQSKGEFHPDWHTVRDEYFAEALIAELAKQNEPIYAFRRKGLDDFCTCDKRRFDELSQKTTLFEVRVFYHFPPTAEQIANETAWRPIETAPKDGSFILLATPKGRIADGFWSLVYGVWSWPYVMVEPTHWMPLPTPPKRSMEGV